MAPVSMTGIGAVVIIIDNVAQLLGLQIPAGSTLAALNGLIQFAGYVFLVWGQLRRTDLHFGLFRKTTPTE